ncbi:MAG: zinc-binding dehydrogenase [Bacteroidia bacterium]|nr:zinc-binding dehydrogenase [Bacteroidia bacterium]
MNALVLKEINQPLEFIEVEKPVLASNEALIKTDYAAINHRDVWISKGMYAGIKTPIILGSDGIGTVDEVSNNIDRDWVGKKVIINPSVNWGNNESVQHKDYTILGLPLNGTFAEYVKVPIKNLQIAPPHLSLEQAAALPLAGLTAYRSLFTRAQVKPNESVLITGIGGGVALFAMQFAIANKNKTYVTSSSIQKIEKAQHLGAIGGAIYKEEGWAKKLNQQSGGFDVIIDSAGGKSFNYLLDLAKPGGRIVFYGGTTGNFENISPQKIFWKQLSLFGSTMGSDKDFEQMIDFVNKYKITPVVDEVFNLSFGNKAFEKMEEGKQFGKIVFKVGH